MFSNLSTRTRRIIAFLGAAIVLSCICLLILVAFPSSDKSTPTPLAQISTTEPVISTPAITPSTNPTETLTIEPTATKTPIFAGMVFGSVRTDTPNLAQASDGSRVAEEVVRVIDGDTIEVAINGQTYRLRYIGMDPPETGDPFSAEATQTNRDLVEEKTVLLETDVSNTDRYVRLLRYVYLADGTFVNAELVRLGLATSKAYPPDNKYQDKLVDMQKEVKANGLKLWAARIQPTSPIQYNILPFLYLLLTRLYKWQGCSLVMCN